MIGKVLAGIRDFLMILLMLGIIAFGVRFLIMLDGAGSQWQEPVADQPCLRDPLHPGCGY